MSCNCFSFSFADMEKCRQMWSVPETNLLLQIWSSVEVQGKLDGATRTKHIYEQIQRKMAAHGYGRSFKQIIHKLMNLKQQNKNWNSHPSRNNHFWVRKHKHVKVLDLVLGDTPACQLTAVKSSAPVQQDTEDNTVSHYSTDSGEMIFFLPFRFYKQSWSEFWIYSVKYLWLTPHSHLHRPVHRWCSTSYWKDGGFRRHHYPRNL